jgi:hypothetical protein
MFAHGITAVIHCSSDVQPQRLRNCLLSVRRQDFNQSEIEIVVGCVRQKQEDVSGLRSLVEEFSGKLVTMENWCPAMNTALSRNLGARRATRLLTAFIDVDSVLDPKVFSLAYPLVEDSRYVIFVRHGHMDNPPEDEIYRLPNSADFRREQKQSKIQDTNVGGNVLLLTSYVQAIRGYDEHMFGWGAEDHDVLARIGRHPKLPVAYGLDCLPVVNMHQHHKSRDWRKTTFFERNFKILIENERLGGKYVNPKFWGGVPVDIVNVDPGYPMDLPPQNGPMGKMDPDAFIRSMGISTHESSVSCISSMRVSKEDRERLVHLLWDKNAFELPEHGHESQVTTVWDVGASCGLYSTWASVRFPKARIHSFEPCSFLAQVAYENMQARNNVEVHRFGLSKGHTGIRPVSTAVIDGRLELRTTEHEDEETTNYELFCSMKEAFNEFCKTGCLDIIRFAPGNEPTELLSALDQEQVSKVRYVQTEKCGLTDDRFERVETKDPGVFCFINKTFKG